MPRTETPRTDQLLAEWPSLGSILDPQQALVLVRVVQDEAVTATLDALAVEVAGMDLPIGNEVHYNRGYSAALAAVLEEIKKAREAIDG